MMALGLGALAAAQPLDAQEPVPSRSLVRGAVIDDSTEKPIGGATVAIETLKASVVTDSTGVFRLAGLPGGRYIISVRRLGYGPLTAVLSLSGRDTLEYDFALVRQPTQLPEVDVTAPRPAPPRLVEFEQRRQAGFGRFLTPDVFEKNVNRRLSEVVATVPGTRIMRGWGNYGWVASSVGSGAIQRGRTFTPSSADIARGADPNQCYAAVMLDGNFVFSGRPGELLFDLNSLGTNTIAGIEYYRDAATVPAKYAGTRGETCGLVLIWTK
jgi:hypothetical protein